MIVNATIVVQAIHFLIAYLLIDRILLRSAVHVIITEQDQEHHIKKTIQNVQESIQMTELKKNKEWQLFKTELRQYIPSLGMLTLQPPLSITYHSYEKLKEKDRKDLIDTLTIAIVKRVTNVR